MADSFLAQDCSQALVEHSPRCYGHSSSSPRRRDRALERGVELLLPAFWAIRRRSARYNDPCACSKGAIDYLKACGHCAAFIERSPVRNKFSVCSVRRRGGMLVSRLWRIRRRNARCDDPCARNRGRIDYLIARAPCKALIEHSPVCNKCGVSFVRCRRWPWGFRQGSKRRRRLLRMIQHRTTALNNIIQVNELVIHHQVAREESLTL